METIFTQQEILLFTDTTFSHRELADRTNPDHNRIFTSAREQLKEGCWNGILGELLPEIIQRAENGKNLFLWNVYDGKSYLGIELGEQLMIPEAEHSLNPNAFLSTACYN